VISPTLSSPMNTGRWIEPVEADTTPDVQRPAYHLALEFTLPAAPVSAQLFATAHGVYEAFINGERVGDIELTPGFSAYRNRLQVHSFDVTNMVREGSNAIGALLSDGWWRGQHGVIREINAYGSTVGFRAELHVTLVNGQTVVIATDESWRSTPSHILAADLIAGEVHDLRRRVDGWANPGTDRSGWEPVLVVNQGTDPTLSDSTLCDPIGPPVRRIEELIPVSITELGPGRHLVDFGQNSNGWIRLTDLGPAGTELTITYGEWVAPDGDLTQDHVANAAFTEPRDISFQTDRVVSAGDGSVFEPRHSTKGFQYVRIEGYPGALDPQSIVSMVVHSDFSPLGSFTCSDARINRLHDVAVWSFRGNACDLPTDCPTRERSGWVGDWQIYVETAAYLYDVIDWSAKWLRDLAADQLPDGRITSIVPDPSPQAPIWSASHGSSGWGDAAVHVPWAMYQASGRTDFFDVQFDSMRRWVDFAVGLAALGRHPNRKQRNEDPLPHERYLWDVGWHFGEWLEPGVNMDTVFASLLKDDHAPVATAYLYRSAHELAAIASLLGHTDDALKYANLASNVLDAWRTEFIDANGNVTPTTQANLTRALAFNLVPDDLRQQTADRLANLVVEADMHLGTGFLATPFLLPMLADHGHLDTAYTLLFQDTEPSWLYMTDRYSTIWEDWDGVVDGVAKHSLNHYSKGAVISFLHHYVAGLQLTEPGYRRIRIAPHPGHGITHAATHHDAPHGRIEVAWRLNETATPPKGTLTATIPEGTVALIALPDGQRFEHGAGVHSFSWLSA
jgi:alpha-L-rhamnosidase